MITTNPFAWYQPQYVLSEEIGMTTVKYVLLTLLKKTARVAIGIQKDHVPIVYWMDRERLKELRNGDYYGSPFIMYEGSLTEEEGKEILSAAEADDYAKAIRLFKKYFRREYSEKVFEEDGAWRPISEEVHDDWFDECKDILSMLTMNIRTVLVYERHEEEYW